MACFDVWDIGACGCTVATYPITIKACNGILVSSGESIQVWTSSGGTLLNTYTVNSSHQISVPTGTYWFISTNGRLAGQNATVGTGTNIITFNAATGYYCTYIGTCLYPWANTLTITDSYLNVNATLIYQSSGTLFGPGWVSGAISCTQANYPGGGCLGTNAMKVQYQWNSGLVVQWYYNVVGLPYHNLGGGGGFSGTSSTCYAPGGASANSETYAEGNNWDASSFGLSPWCSHSTTFVVSE
jgi:hypothetical protein